MRVMVFAKTTEDSEKGEPPTPEAFAAMDRFIEELAKAGVFVAGAGLKNSAQAKRIVCEMTIGGSTTGRKRSGHASPPRASNGWEPPHRCAGRGLPHSTATSEKMVSALPLDQAGDPARDCSAARNGRTSGQDATAEFAASEIPWGIGR